MASAVAMVTAVHKGLNFLPWPTHTCCSAFILIAPPHSTCSSCICSCFPPFVQPFILLCDYPNPFGPLNYIFTRTRCSRTPVWMQILKCCYAIKSPMRILSHTDRGKNTKSATVSTVFCCSSPSCLVAGEVLNNVLRRLHSLLAMVQM